jgi:hypothetical protein
VHDFRGGVTSAIGSSAIGYFQPLPVGEQILSLAKKITLMASHLQKLRQASLPFLRSFLIQNSPENRRKLLPRRHFRQIIFPTDLSLYMEGSICFVRRPG